MDTEGKQTDSKVRRGHGSYIRIPSVSSPVWNIDKLNHAEEHIWASIDNTLDFVDDLTLICTTYEELQRKTDNLNYCDEQTELKIRATKTIAFETKHINLTP